MEQWLLRTPKALLALIIGAILTGFLLLAEPPPTICSTQLEVFKEAQQSFLYQRGSSKTPLPPEFEVEFSKCAEVAGMGGCFALFDSLKKLIREIQPLRSECQQDAARSPEVRKALERSYTLMAHLAWGGGVPARPEDRTGWLQKADLHLFCQIDKYLRLGKGDQGIASLQREIMDTLPHAVEVSSEEVWAKTILSLNCQNIR